MLPPLAKTRPWPFTFNVERGTSIVLLLCWALALATPAWRSGPWGGAEGFGALAALPVLAGAAWLAARLARGWRVWRWGEWTLTGALWALGGLSILHGLAAGTWAAAVPILGLWLAGAGYLFLTNLDTRPGLTALLAAVALAQGGVAVAQFLAQGAVGLGALGEIPLDRALTGTSVLWARGEPWLRAYGLTAHPNALGALLAVVLLGLLSRVAEARSWARLALAAAWGVGLLGLLASFSRAAWLGFALGLLAWAWQRGSRQAWLAGAGVVALVALALLPYADLAASRWATLDTPIEARSLFERQRDARLAWALFGAHPLTGVGSANSVAAARGLDPAALVVHNVPLLVAAEWGVPGLLGWAWLTVAGFRRRSRWPVWAALCAISLFDLTLWPGAGLRPALLWALAAAGMETERQKAKGKRQKAKGTATSPLRWLASHIPHPTSHISHPTSPIPPLASRLPLLLLSLLALTFAFEPTRPLGGAGRLVVTWVEAAALGAVGAWALACVAARRWPAVPRAVAAPVALWLGVVLVAALFAPDQRAHGLKLWGRMVGGALVAWATFDLARGPGAWWRVAQAMALGGALVGLLGLAEAGGVAPWLAGFKKGVARVGDLVRVSSTLPFPTIAAVVLEMTLPLLLAWAVTSRRAWQRAALAAGLVAGMATLVLTLSRAGVALLGAAWLAMAALAWWHRQRAEAGALRRGALVAAATLALLTAVVFVANPLVKLRLLSETEQAWYRATYRSAPLPALRPGQRVQVPIEVRNAGVRPWEPTGAEPFTLSYHLLRADGTPLQYDGPRTPLPEAIPPGATVTLQAFLTAPDVPGRYLVEWEMLQEDVAWFSWKGTPTLRVPLTVSGSAAAVAQPSGPIPEPVVRIPTPGRRTLWLAAARMVRERPLLGWGPGTFRLRYGAFLGMDVWDPTIHANNSWLEWAAGTGLLGLAAFGWLTVAVARLAWRGLAPRGALWPWRVAVAAALAAWLLHGLLDSFWEWTPTYMAFWLLVGLAAAGERVDDDGLAHRL